ncbi:MAG: RNA methyltransferase, partial [Chloroflexi bacterium]|nr:RNA methyltransferase [Chloroflexota bacterium]
MNKITSPSNPKIKQIRALKQRKQRDASGLFAVEGLHHIGEAIAAEAPIDYILYSPELLNSQFGISIVDRLTKEGVGCHETDQDIFRSVSEKDNPQGLIAVIRQNTTILNDLNPTTFPWAVVVVAPQDPGNLGAIMRSIDAVAASGLIILDDGVDVYHPKAVRASMGALFWHPLVRAGFEEFAEWTNTHGYHVYGSSAQHGEKLAEGKPFDRPAILLLGSEREGLGDQHVAICERVIHLPMHGRVTSLNLAVAAGILL